MKKILIATVLASSLVGCASVPMGDAKQDAVLKTFSVPADKAGVYIYRNEQLGGAYKMDVEIDGETIGQTAVNTYLYKEVAPGKHTISSKAENTDSMEIEAKLGTLSYIWQEAKLGFSSVRTKLHLVDETEGKKGVLETKLAQTNMQHSQSYQEGLVGGFNPGEWTVGNSIADQNQRITEFVRHGETIGNWTELLTMQTLKKPVNPEPIAAMVARVHTDDAKSCPNGFTQNVIAQGFPTDTEEASIIYEWQFTNCSPHADQHEVAKIIYGKFNIFRLAYIAKTKKLAPEVREQWIKELKDTKIMVINK